MPRCAGSKPDGTPCERIVGASQRYCYSHDPGRSEERKRNASRAGRSKPSQEIVGLKRQLQGIADAVLDGSIQQGRGAVAIQAMNALARVLELERRWRELGEVEARLDVLERRLDPRRAS